MNKLNQMAVHQVTNHLLSKRYECNVARRQAQKECKSNSEIQEWADMQVIYNMLLHHLKDLNNL